MLEVAELRGFYGSAVSASAGGRSDPAARRPRYRLGEIALKLLPLKGSSR